MWSRYKKNATVCNLGSSDVIGAKVAKSGIYLYVDHMKIDLIFIKMLIYGNMTGPFPK